MHLPEAKVPLGALSLAFVRRVPITHSMEAAPTIRRADAAERGATRDLFLDTIRTIALVRVMLWHAFGEPVLTYLIAAVPTMFFVSGSLLAKSLDRRPWPRVLSDRLRRILVPLWLFTAVAFVAMRVAWLLDPSPRTAVPWRSIVFWIVPLGDPQGSAWEGGWMSQPLWYVRAMFWLLLLSPLLRAALRRVGVFAFVSPLVVVFALDALTRNPAFTIHAAPQLLWQLGDVALYSIFLMAGFAHRDGRFAHLRPDGWLRGAIFAGIASVAWITTQPVPLHVVNNSHPAHLFVGTAWLCIFFACRAPITAAADTPAGRAIVGWISQRSMTIYLWHSTAIILTYHVLATRDGYPRGVYAAAMIAGMVSITMLFVVAFGWVEDLAARRALLVCPLVVHRGDSPADLARFATHRRSVYRLVGVPALAGALLLSGCALVTHPSIANQVATPDGIVSAAKSTKRPPVPSQAPPRPEFVRTATTSASPPTTSEPRTSVVTPEAAPSPLAPRADAALASVLQTTVDGWRVRWGVPGIAIGVVAPGVAMWQGASGTDPFTGNPVGVDDRFDITSVTKTFTGTLVFQLAAEGRIDLDAPLPRLDRVPDFPYASGITVRQLLVHRSGLVPYRDTPTYAAAPDAIDTPASALAAALREPLQFAPGTKSAYSSTNFLVLGFLIEQVTGLSYDTLLTQRLIEPVGLQNITHSAPSAQQPNFATSGIVIDTANLLRWGVALYRDHVVIDTIGLAAMHDIDTSTGLGPAVYGYCPCAIDDTGQDHWQWIGHTGGTTELAYSDADDLAIALNVTDSLWLPDRGRAIAELLALLRVAMLEARPPAALPAFS
jgi:CubicO group peptidase (beta-lactamase class C family)/surface polysaccharide O-acyltransferase-like enzyme